MALKASEIYSKSDGLYSLGGGLYLRVSSNGKRRVWVARGTTRENSSYSTLGDVAVLSYREARRKLSGGSRIDDRGIPTFEEACTETLEELFFKKQYKQARTEHLIRSRIQKYILPSLRHERVDEISSSKIYEIIKPLWIQRTPTASRILGILEELYDIWIFKGYCKENPVPKVFSHLPSFSKTHRTSHLASIDYRDLPDFCERLYKIKSHTSLTILLLALTALRVSELISLRREDIKQDYFEIRPEKRKGHKTESLRVPLTSQSRHLLELLDESWLCTHYTTLYKSFKTLSNTTLHGFRSSFRNWAAEGNKNFFACEIQLSHTTGSSVTTSYMRTDFLEERRKILKEWNNYLFLYINKNTTKKISVKV